jgi:hypothetical protein
MNTCSICLDIIENNNKCVTICEHYFCFLCISKWLYIYDTCPCCRNVITISTFKKKKLPKKTLVFGPLGVLKDKWIIITNTNINTNKVSIIGTIKFRIYQFFTEIYTYIINKIK